MQIQMQMQMQMQIIIIIINLPLDHEFLQIAVRTLGWMEMGHIISDGSH